MKEKKKESINELAYNWRTSFAKVIACIIIPIFLLIFVSEKIAEYNDSCVSWFDYRKSKKIEINNEKPIRLEKLDGYYAIHFSNDQVIYTCDLLKKYEDNILAKTISKKKNSELIRVFNENNEETESFSIHWTNWTGWN